MGIELFWAYLSTEARDTLASVLFVSRLVENAENLLIKVTYSQFGVKCSFVFV